MYIIVIPIHLHLSQSTLEKVFKCEITSTTGFGGISIFNKIVCVCINSLSLPLLFALNSSVFTRCYFKITFHIMNFFSKRICYDLCFQYKQQHFRAVVKGKCQKSLSFAVLNISKELKERYPQLHPLLPQPLLYFAKHTWNLAVSFTNITRLFFPT